MEGGRWKKRPRCCRACGCVEIAPPLIIIGQFDDARASRNQKLFHAAVPATIGALCPPKPKLLLNTKRRFCSCGTFRMRFRSVVGASLRDKTLEQAELPPLPPVASCRAAIRSVLNLAGNCQNMPADCPHGGVTIGLGCRQRRPTCGMSPTSRSLRCDIQRAQLFPIFWLHPPPS